MNSPPKNWRPATDKQLAYIRSFGVKPEPNISIAEASELLYRLESDPKARERQIELDIPRNLALARCSFELAEEMRRTPATKGIGEKAKRLRDECKDGLVWLTELERRFTEIVQHASFDDEDERETLKEDFDQRMADIKEAMSIYVVMKLGTGSNIGSIRPTVWGSV